MPALSTKDKLKLRLSAAKVERWNRERLKPAVNVIVTASGKEKPVERCRVKWAHGQVKQTPVYPDKDVVPSAPLKMRSASDKLTLVRRGDNFSDYQDASYSDTPRDPAWKANAPKVAKARPDSPFKRAGQSAAKVVIVRKGKPE